MSIMILSTNRMKEIAYFLAWGRIHEINSKAYDGSNLEIDGFTDVQPADRCEENAINFANLLIRLNVESYNQKYRKEIQPELITDFDGSKDCTVFQFYSNLKCILYNIEGDPENSFAVPELKAIIKRVEKYFLDKYLRKSKEWNATKWG